MSDERIKNEFTKFDAERPEMCKPNERCGFDRVVKCDGGDRDVVECSKCGKQRTVRCNFDDDYS